MPYRHDQQLYKKKTRSKIFVRISAFLILITIASGLYIAFDWFRENIGNDTVVSSTTQASVQSATINVFQSPDFRFQTDDSWREVTDQFNNPQNEYIYRSYDNKLIEHELWITVNKPKTYELEKHYPTRVLPVIVTTDGRLIQDGPVSEPCVATLPKDGSPSLEPQSLIQIGITYFCYPNSTAYNVTLGVVDGNNELIMPNGDGTDVMITMVYKNVTALPDSQQLEQILETFSVQ